MKILKLQNHMQYFFFHRLRVSMNYLFLLKKTHI